MNIAQVPFTDNQYKIKIGSMSFSKDADLLPNFIDWQFTNYCSWAVEWIDQNYVDQVKYECVIQDHMQMIDRTCVTWYAAFPSEKTLAHFMLCNEELFKD